MGVGVGPVRAVASGWSARGMTWSIDQILEVLEGDQDSEVASALVAEIAELRRELTDANRAHNELNRVLGLETDSWDDVIVYVAKQRDALKRSNSSLMYRANQLAEVLCVPPGTRWPALIRKARELREVS